MWCNKYFENKPMKNGNKNWFRKICSQMIARWKGGWNWFFIIINNNNNNNQDGAGRLQFRRRRRICHLLQYLPLPNSQLRQQFDISIPCHIRPLFWIFHDIRYPPFSRRPFILFSNLGLNWWSRVALSNLFNKVKIFRVSAVARTLTHYPPRIWCPDVAYCPDRGTTWI